MAAWTPTGNGPRVARNAGTLDAAPATAAATIDGADLVILAGPPMAVLAGLDELAGLLRGSLGEHATITDVASTKAIIVARSEDLGLPFVGGHPMAGRETSGFGAATADLFEDRPWVVIPAPDAPERDRTRVEALVRAVGARPVSMSAIDHDLAVAAISHLPLVAAAALVESVAGDADQWPGARALAAGGWRDMTRLARGDAGMGGDILATNARPVVDALREYRYALDAWIGELERISAEDAPALPDASSAERLRDRLQAARDALEREPKP
jgi:prephenate dehydrogenase